MQKTVKKYHVLGISIIVIAAIALYVLPSARETGADLRVRPQAEPQVPAAPKIPEPTGPRVTIGSDVISVDVSRTKAEVEQGLSGRESLPDDHGMLFAFPDAQIYSFWMPDMHFDIDIIWVDDGEVVDVTRNASKDFDPMKPVFYKPKSPARYVLEVNAGYADLHGIKIGEKVSFTDISDP